MMRSPSARMDVMTRLMKMLALGFALALAAPAMAHDGAVAAAKATEAAAALQAFSDGARHAGRRPDFAAAPAGELLRVLFDADRLAALPAPASSDLAWLLDWVEAANRGYKQMVMVGLLPGQPPDEAKLARNLQDYEDQMAPALNFLVRAMARQMDAMAMFAAELPKEQMTPVRVAGFRGARAFSGSYLQTVLCVAQAMKPGNGRIVMKAIDDTRASWIAALYPEDRSKAMATLKIMSQQAGDGDVSHRAGALLAAFRAKQ